MYDLSEIYARSTIIAKSKLTHDQIEKDFMKAMKEKKKK